jgi:hypothetical protein
VIREATPLDLPRLVAMGREFLHGSAYQALIADNPEQMEALASSLIERDGGVVLVADHSGELTGMIGVLVTAHHLSAEPVAMEAFWWASTPGDGVRLLKASESWARANGAVAMQMVAPDERVGALYARSGYALIEHGYMKRFDS